MNKMYHYNKNQCLVNLSNTILAHYGLKHEHESIQPLLKTMQKFDKIAFLLFDGMGKSLIEGHLSEASFLRKHVMMEIDSVFPPTTVAATNAFLSGKYPKETNWLGWSQYFKKEDVFIDVFSNRETWTKTLLSKENPMVKVGAYEDVFAQVAKARPEVKVKMIWPAFKKGGAKDLEEWITMIHQHLQTNQKSLIYGYFENPDHAAHDHGINSMEVKNEIYRINDAVEYLTKENPDTLFIVFADHSLVDVQFIYIDEHPDFFDTLIRPFSIEPRASTFYVKEDKKEEFEKLFQKYYGDYFELFTKEEVLKENIFGLGAESPYFQDFIGDYLAVSTDRYCFDYILPSRKNEPIINMIAAHAGGTEEEHKIDLIVIAD